MKRGLAAMRELSHRTAPVQLLTLLVAWCLAASQVTHGSEFHFVVEDLEDNRASWSPDEVVIHKDTDLKGRLVFVLENPTSRTHVFLADGLFEEVRGENSDATAKPLRVTVAPKETVQTQVSTRPFEEAHEEVGVGEVGYRFFCPLHKGDADLGGMIRVMPYSRVGGASSR